MKKIMLFSLQVLAVMLLSNCSDDSSGSSGDHDVFMYGAKSVQRTCLSCHAPVEKNTGVIAPSLIDLQKSYKQHFSNQSDFVSGMVSFLRKPSLDHSIMEEAVEKYGLMPNMGLPKGQYEQIATFLYQVDMSEENWLNKAINESAADSQSVGQTIDYLAKGRELALSTKAVLGKNLLGAIKSKGTTGALGFCNTRAYPLTDSMSQVLNASIKRVSDQNRNPDNQANPNELAFIKKAKAALEMGQEIEAQVYEAENEVVGYYPIMTNQMCLQCHGNPEQDIDLETLALLEDLYPSDQATGYGPDQLRGIWVVRMKKEEIN